MPLSKGEIERLFGNKRAELEELYTSKFLSKNPIKSTLGYMSADVWGMVMSHANAESRLTLCRVCYSCL